MGGPYSINPQSGSRIGGQGQIWQRGGQVRTVLLMDFATFQLRCTVYAYFIVKTSKIAITHFGGQV